jgi:hypothetical protein
MADFMEEQSAVVVRGRIRSILFPDLSAGNGTSISASTIIRKISVTSYGNLDRGSRSVFPAIYAGDVSD